MKKFKIMGGINKAVNVKIDTYGMIKIKGHQLKLTTDNRDIAGTVLADHFMYDDECTLQFFDVDQAAHVHVHVQQHAGMIITFVVIDGESDFTSVHTYRSKHRGECNMFMYVVPFMYDQFFNA